MYKGRHEKQVSNKALMMLRKQQHIETVRTSQLINSRFEYNHSGKKQSALSIPSVYDDLNLKNPTNSKLHIWNSAQNISRCGYI